MTYSVNCRCILELGSGLGFTGIVISKICQPRRFTFSDCHEQVLQKLATNIVHNLVKCVHVLDTCHRSNGQDNLIKFEEAVDFKNVQVPTKSSFSDECSDCRLTSEKLFNLCCNELYEMYWKLTPSSNSDKITSPIQVMQLKADKSVHLVRLDWEKFNRDEILKAFCEVDTIIAAGKLFVSFPQLLPPAYEVCEGYVFTGVCLSRGEVSVHRGVSAHGGSLCPGGVSVQGGISVQGGGLCPGGSLSMGGSLSWRPPPPVTVTCGR